MSLTPGTRLGPYEVVASIGAGGMGEVYRARDQRLGRDVAIKVLPSAVSTNADRLARFEREARAAAALNHPNILAVHDVGQHEGAPYIVSELLDGQTLRQRLAGGALSARRATEYAVEIARGLSSAHEKAIVHRDLKPENVLVTVDGRVKILDFGLAKLLEVEPSAGASQAPTTPLETEPGVVLGTIGYMAPEQVRGQAVDDRTDIFALGAILYEMLAGVRAFEGATRADTLAAVLEKDPPEQPLAERRVPPALARIIDRCLQKNRSARFQSAGDLAFALEGVASPSEIVEAPRGGHAVANRRRLSWALFGVGLAAALALGTMAVYIGRPAPEARPFKATILPPPDVRITDRGAVAGALGGSPARRLAISPDGERLAFTAAGRDGVIWLWVRRLDSLMAQRLDGTEGAVYPFWSPDSRFIGFFSEDGKRRSKLLKIDASRGSPVTLCELPGTNSTGGTWNRDGVILFGMFATKQGEIQRVSAAGGAHSPVTMLDVAAGETRHWTPSFLPDGRHFLYLVSGIKAGGPFDANGLYVGSLDSQERTQLIPGGAMAKYSDGHLLFLRGGLRNDGTLLARPFDPVSLTFTGEAVSIAEGVYVGGPTGVAGAFTVSDNGILAYQTGSNPLSRLTWFARDGKQLEPLGEPGIYGDLELSPDGSRAAITVEEALGNNADVWVYDVARGIRSRVTFDTTLERGALWSPDGLRLVFSSNRHGDFNQFDLFVKPASATGPGQPLLVGTQALLAESWSPDGRFIAFASPQVPFAGNPGSDIWVLPQFGDQKPSPFVQTPFAEAQPRFSPDGQWMAYTSNESGRSEVYVVPFPGRGGKWQVSTAGGSQPRWRRDGKEIFYVAGAMLMAAGVNGRGTAFEVETARPLFAIRPSGLGESYDVSGDGQRFLVNMLLEIEEAPVTLVVNWRADTKR